MRTHSAADAPVLANRLVAEIGGGGVDPDPASLLVIPGLVAVPPLTPGHPGRDEKHGRDRQKENRG